MPVAPCAYPGCDDGEGNAALTTDVICTRSRRHYRKVLDWLTIDYVTVKTQMPKPAKRTAGAQRRAQREYGHPAEWASDMAREIAEVMNLIEDGLRDYRGDEPPPNLRTAAEPRVVEHARRYFDVRFDDLCTYPAAADTAVELDDLHQKVRRALGQTRFAQRIPTPCPECDVAALVRTVDQIDCRSCGAQIPESHYEFFANVLIDEVIRAYDTRATG